MYEYLFHPTIYIYIYYMALFVSMGFMHFAFVGQNKYIFLNLIDMVIFLFEKLGFIVRMRVKVIEC